MGRIHRRSLSQAGFQPGSICLLGERHSNVTTGLRFFFFPFFFFFFFGRGSFLVFYVMKGHTHTPCSLCDSGWKVLAKLLNTTANMKPREMLKLLMLGNPK